MRTRTVLLIIATLLFATVASAVPYRYVIATFYEWKAMTKEQMARAKIDNAFVRNAAMTSMENVLNAAAANGWEPVTTTFVPGTPGQDDPRRAADRLVIIMRNPNPPPKQ